MAPKSETVFPYYNPFNPVDEYRIVGQRLREARVGRGWHQDDVRALIGLHPSILCNIELGKRKPTVFELAALCELYRVSMAYVVRGEVATEEEAHLLKLCPEVRAAADRLEALPAPYRALLTCQIDALVGGAWRMVASGQMSPVANTVTPASA
jgi:transcriptional regulator with XRE-family HTH domain